jgi:hypothetical protein
VRQAVLARLIIKHQKATLAFGDFWKLLASGLLGRTPRFAAFTKKSVTFSPTQAANSFLPAWTVLACRSIQIPPHQRWQNA